MGTCYDYTIKWFYDASISRCRRFYYGSCGGNGNRFETREDCVMTCVERRAKPMVEVVVEKGSGLLCMSLAWLLIHELTTRWHGCMFTNSEHDCLSGCSFVWFVRNYSFPFQNVFDPVVCVSVATAYFLSYHHSLHSISIVVFLLLRLVSPRTTIMVRKILFKTNSDNIYANDLRDLVYRLNL